MIFIGKNNAGQARFMLTITGSIIVLLLAWVLGRIFMPKSNSTNENEKIIGVWYCKSDSGYKRLEAKRSGYFYFDDAPKNGKSFHYRGVITKTIKDTLTLEAFYIDTILFHRILAFNKKQLTLKSLKDSSILNFIKYE